MFGGVGPSRKSWKEYVKEWQVGMKKAYEIASEVSQKVARRNKAQYDKRAGASTLEVGDRVLVRNLREKGGPGKLRAQWEGRIYLVKERRGDGPVYVVQCGKGGEERVLHRNHLLPVGEKVRMEEPETTHKGKEVVAKKKDNEQDKGNRKRARKEQKKVEMCEEEEVEDVRSSDESTSDEDERRRSEVRKSRRRRRKKPDVFMYHRMGSPGQVNRVSTNTPHTQNKSKTTTHPNERTEQNKILRPQQTTILQNTDNTSQTQQTNNLQNKNNTIQTQQIYNSQHADLYDAERQHGCSMEHTFLMQMLEQQQVLTSMLFSVMCGGSVQQQQRPQQQQQQQPQPQRQQRQQQRQ